MKPCIGENIKNLRENMHLTQSNLAHFLEVDQSLISKIEKGEREISTDMLEKISCLFGVTIDSIENDNVEASKLSFALRAKDLNEKDMETICAINRIALNVNFMNKMLKGED